MIENIPSLYSKMGTFSFLKRGVNVKVHKCFSCGPEYNGNNIRLCNEPFISVRVFSCVEPSLAHSEKGMGKLWYYRPVFTNAVSQKWVDFIYIIFIHVLLAVAVSILYHALLCGVLHNCL